MTTFPLSLFSSLIDPYFLAIIKQVQCKSLNVITGYCYHSLNLFVVPVLKALIITTTGYYYYSVNVIPFGPAKVIAISGFICIRMQKF